MPRLALLALLVLLAGCARPDLAPPANSVPVEAEHTEIYELYVRSFTPEGTLRAAIPRLPELRTLGVDVIWLMPIHPVGEARRKGTLGSPYSVRDYTAVNPRFGTMDDLRAFVEAAHASGLRVIIDWVANHTAFDHEWTRTHPEWYTRDDAGAIVHPEGTDWTDVADLNYEDPGLRDAMRAAMRFWVEDIGIDGYRCDVAELVPLDFWEDAIAELRAIKPVLMLAEGAAPSLYDAGFDLTYAWDTYGALKAIWRGAPADTLFAVLDAERAQYGDAPRMRFTTNHDETAWDDTPLALFGGPDGARAAAVLAATLPGAFLVYNGQEVGDPQRLPLFEQAAINWEADPAMREFFAELLARRDASAALREGRLEPVAHDAPEDVIAFRRVAGGASALVVVNARDRAVVVTLPELGQIELAPHEWRIEPRG